MKLKLAVLSLFVSVAAFSQAKKPPAKAESTAGQVSKCLPGKSPARYKPGIGYDFKNAEAVAAAQEIINRVLCSDCFEGYMRSRGLIQTEGLDWAGVVNKLREQDLETPVVMYYKDNNVIGYRTPPEKTIHTNGKFHWGSSPKDRAQNLFHEWVHVVGFSHEKNPSKSRPRSVPYSAGYSISACFTENKP